MQKLIVLAVFSILCACFYGCNKQDSGRQGDRNKQDRCG